MYAIFVTTTVDRPDGGRYPANVPRPAAMLIALLAGLFVASPWQQAGTSCVQGTCAESQAPCGRTAVPCATAPACCTVDSGGVALVADRESAPAEALAPLPSSTSLDAVLQLAT